MQGDSIFYQVKKAKLVPDKYGKHIVITMISAYTGRGKFVKHIKLDDKSLKILTEGWIIHKEDK